MKNRKKYGNGSGRQGVGPTNYITNPSETLAEYNIMLGKAENEALKVAFTGYMDNDNLSMVAANLDSYNKYSKMLEKAVD